MRGVCDVDAVSSLCFLLGRGLVGAGDGVLGAFAGASHGESCRAGALLRDRSRQPIDDFSSSLDIAVGKQQPEFFSADASENVAGAQLVAPCGGGLFEGSPAGWPWVSLNSLN
jgi:hypothetical protein